MKRTALPLPFGFSWCHPRRPWHGATTGTAAFTSTAKVDKWFRRNCNDVLSRECTAVEKADVLAYLNALKP